MALAARGWGADGEKGGGEGQSTHWKILIHPGYVVIIIVKLVLLMLQGCQFRKRNLLGTNHLFMYRIPALET